MHVSDHDIAAMSTDERLDLLEWLWERLSPDDDAVSLTDSQRIELHRRLDALDREGAVGVSWADALREARRPGA
ncbi:MAG: addiction module protein [Chloroflexi bacterium]|nr:addiction module protein [Chloroflexota bacterium]